MDRARRVSALLAALVAGCATPSTRDVRVTIVDEAGDPLPGAVLYVEAGDATGAFDFLTATAGAAGVLPDQAREPLKIAWRPGAHLALAAFHPGYRPLVVLDPSRRIRSDGALLTLTRGDAPEPRVAELAFPFEDRPALAARAAAPECAPLRSAFRRAWQGLPEEVKERKNRAMDAIEPGILLQRVDDPVDPEESDGSPEPRRNPIR